LYSQISQICLKGPHYTYLSPTGRAELNAAQRSARAVFISAAAARMGQQLSGQAVLTRLPEKLVKHAGLVRDSGYLTYEEFLARVSELNDV